MLPFLWVTPKAHEKQVCSIGPTETRLRPRLAAASSHDDSRGLCSTTLYSPLTLRDLRDLLFKTGLRPTGLAVRFLQ
jgi:hypothetical protein